MHEQKDHALGPGREMRRLHGQRTRRPVGIGFGGIQLLAEESGQRQRTETCATHLQQFAPRKSPIQIGIPMPVHKGPQFT